LPVTASSAKIQRFLDRKRMRKKGRNQAKIVTRCMRAAAALVCAYAVALTTILSSWSALALALPASGDGAVICVAHADGANGSAPVHRHSQHMLCSQLCSMAGCSADLALTVNTIFKPIAAGALLGRLAGSGPGEAASAVFLSDHWVRGPPAA
jgi:hypothetical protein